METDKSVHHLPDRKRRLVDVEVPEDSRMRTLSGVIA